MDQVGSQTAASQPGGALRGIRVLDLSTLLPGPLAALMLADAGADVIKIERPGFGDEMRTYQPRVGSASANYALLNRGKRAFAADLKKPADRQRVLEVAGRADVVIEQFRPGVAERLGVGYEAVRMRNQAVIYCSISGYGRVGDRVGRAGHDLNYLAEAGLLGVVTDDSGTPQLPVTVLADIAGGTYPAVANIAMALFRRERTGQGCHLDIGMVPNLETLAYGYLATYRASGHWPTPSRELLTGGSPRYQIYETADHRFLAVAALEDRFWSEFTRIIGLPAGLANDDIDPDVSILEIAALVRRQTAAEWQSIIGDADVCVSVVATFDEAMDEGLIGRPTQDFIVGPGYDVPALHTPIAEGLRGSPGGLPFPDLTALPEDCSAIWPRR